MDGRAHPLMDRKVVGASGYLFVYLSISLPDVTCLSFYLPIYCSSLVKLVSELISFVKLVKLVELVKFVKLVKLVKLS